VFSFVRPKETSGTNWNLATKPELEGYVVHWSYSRAEVMESNDPPYGASGVDSHPARGFQPATLNPLGGGNISRGWEATPLSFEGPSTEAGENDLYALPSLPRDTSEYLACGPCIFVPPVIIWLSISGDTDVPGTGSPEMFTIGTLLLGGGLASTPRLAASGTSAADATVMGRTLGGAVNGGLSAGISGGDLDAVARGALIGGALSAWSPFGFVGNWRVHWFMGTRRWSRCRKHEYSEPTSGKRNKRNSAELDGNGGVVRWRSGLRWVVWGDERRARRYSYRRHPLPGSGKGYSRGTRQRGNWSLD
jgi:hypothetical protein